MSGLFTKLNLSEFGLNGTEAVQKLYEPQVQNDINLFAFSSRLESTVQVSGLINEPFSSQEGDIFLRTRFVTNVFTFSNRNQVWFDKSVIPGVKISGNGPIVNVSLLSPGRQYGVKTQAGTEVETYPATVQVAVLGTESGSSNARIEVTVDSLGKLLPTATIVTPGSGYLDGEILELLPACQSEEIPSQNKCLNYESGNYLFQVYFSENGEIGYPALIKNDKYLYTVLSSSSEGFFLFDGKKGEWLYSGPLYNNFTPLPPNSIQISRADTIESGNIGQLYGLNNRSYFFGYGGSGFSPSQSLGNTLRSISDQLDSLRDRFKSLIQNVRTQKTEFNEENELGLRYNILEGKNIFSDYRVVFRDPDSVLDQESVDFFSLRDLLDAPDQVVLNNEAVPGIWIFTGEKYQRVFSTDDKPFISRSGRNYLSPKISDTNGDPITDLRYSISAAYLKPGTTEVKGFDTEISVLVQNISSTTGNGGFVYHRTLIPTAVTGSVTRWPLLSYRDSIGTIRDAMFLAI